MLTLSEQQSQSLLTTKKIIGKAEIGVSKILEG